MAASTPIVTEPAAEVEDSIQMAAGDDRLDAVKAFVVAGVSVNTADENGYTALHAAASYGATATLAWLLEQGASVTAVDGVCCGEKQFPQPDCTALTPAPHTEEGDTPLHACESVECADVLLRAGADLAATNSLGLYPIQTMAGNEADELVEALRPMYATAGIALPEPLLPPNYRFGELVPETGGLVVDEDGDIETEFPDA